MGALVIKTGMSVEQQIARKYAAPDVTVLVGLATASTLDQVVPNDCEAIMSLGVCGGLAPQAQIGQTFIYSKVVTPTDKYLCDPVWRKRLFSATHYYECHCYSSGEFNTANDEVQREQLFAQTGCWIIDDESFAVAEFAIKRNIAFIGLRTVSDGAEDNLPPAIINALNPDGTDNLRAVIESVVTDPLQIPTLIKTALEAKKSFDELETACIAVGANFQWV